MALARPWEALRGQGRLAVEDLAVVSLAGHPALGRGSPAPHALGLVGTGCVAGGDDAGQRRNLVNCSTVKSASRRMLRRVPGGSWCLLSTTTVTSVLLCVVLLIDRCEPFVLCLSKPARSRARTT